MPYLILKDYYSTIQDVSLQQVISNDDSFRLVKQQAALDEIKSYLVQKYDVSDEFRETEKFSFTKSHKAKQLVYLDGPTWSNATQYALNDIVLKTGKVYRSIQANNTGQDPATQTAWWTLLGNQYDFFYIPLPYPEFNYETIYEVGDLVFWKDKVHKCLSKSAPRNHMADIQYDSYAEIPFINQFPDAKQQTQWTASSAYAFSGLWPTTVPGDFAAWNGATAYVTGNRVQHDTIIWQAMANSTNVTPGTDITKWLPVSWLSGDNRNAQLVEILTHITIYKLSTRISPRNIPDIWVKNYDDAIRWLKKCAKGEVTLDCPLLQPAQGRRIRWGSQVKNNNNF